MIWGGKYPAGPRASCFSFFSKKYKRTVGIETKKVMVYVCMAQATEGACQKGEEGVDTLQAADFIESWGL